MSEQLNLPLQPMNPMVSQPGQYVFPTYWGGMAVSPNPPQIHGKLRELRQAVGGLKAKKVQGGPMFPVRGAKELAQKLAQALNDLDMVAPVIAQEVTLVDTKDIPSNATNSGKPVFRTLAHVKSTVRVGAPDGSYVDMVGSGHGGDVDDKAGGKADTYGWKIAILKGLTIPEEDMVDTDDDSSDTKELSASPNKFSPSRTSPRQAQAVKPKGEDTAGNDTRGDVDAVIKRIQAADDAELTAIKDGIQNGSIALAGADRLRASTEFVKRRKILDAEKNAGK
jgi:hypothetical protein